MDKGRDKQWLTQEHPPGNDDELWDDIIGSIDEGAIIGQCSPQSSPHLLKGTPTKTYKGNDIVPKVGNNPIPTCMLKVTLRKPMIRVDKEKEKND